MSQDRNSKNSMSEEDRLRAEKEKAFKKFDEQAKAAQTVAIELEKKIKNMKTPPKQD